MENKRMTFNGMKSERGQNQHKLAFKIAEHFDSWHKTANEDSNTTSYDSNIFNPRVRISMVVDNNIHLMDKAHFMLPVTERKKYLREVTDKVKGYPLPMQRSAREVADYDGFTPERTKMVKARMQALADDALANAVSTGLVKKGEFKAKALRDAGGRFRVVVSRVG